VSCTSLGSRFRDLRWVPISPPVPIRPFSLCHTVGMRVLPVDRLTPFFSSPSPRCSFRSGRSFSSVRFTCFVPSGFAHFPSPFCVFLLSLFLLVATRSNIDFGLDTCRRTSTLFDSSSVFVSHLSAGDFSPPPFIRLCFNGPPPQPPPFLLRAMKPSDPHRTWFIPSPQERLSR